MAADVDVTAQVAVVHTAAAALGYGLTRVTR
jgi:hypothetical protein